MGSIYRVSKMDKKVADTKYFLALTEKQDFDLNRKLWLFAETSCIIFSYIQIYSAVFYSATLYSEILYWLIDRYHILPLYSSGPWHVVLAPTQRGEVSGGPAQFHPLPWRLDSGRQGPVWAGLQLPWQELPPHPADGGLPLPYTTILLQHYIHAPSTRYNYITTALHPCSLYLIQL